MAKSTYVRFIRIKNPKTYDAVIRALLERRSEVVGSFMRPSLFESGGMEADVNSHSFNLENRKYVGFDKPRSLSANPNG
jgi:hypothetical protein